MLNAKNLSTIRMLKQYQQDTNDWIAAFHDYFRCNILDDLVAKIESIDFSGPPKPLKDYFSNAELEFSVDYFDDYLRQYSCEATENAVKTYLDKVLGRLFPLLTIFVHAGDEKVNVKIVPSHSVPEEFMERETSFVHDAERELYDALFKLRTFMLDVIAKEQKKIEESFKFIIRTVVNEPQFTIKFVDAFSRQRRIFKNKRLGALIYEVVDNAKASLVANREINKEMMDLLSFDVEPMDNCVTDVYLSVSPLLITN